MVSTLGEFGTLGDHPGQQGHDAVGRDLEPGRVEDLRADVRVQADQRQSPIGQDPADGLVGGPSGQREAELLVLVRGGDELVGVRLDPHGDPDHHRHRWQAGQDPRLGDPGQSADLMEGVDDDRADPGLDGHHQLGVGLVRSVQRDPMRRESALERQRQLATGAHVETEALLVQPPDDGRRQERLARVVHVARGAERVGEVLASRPEVVLVQHHQRRAVLFGQRHRVHPGELHGAGRRAARTTRPDGRGERHQVGRWGVRAGLRQPIRVTRARRVRRHMRSGASTPSIARALNRTCRVARHSHSREIVAGPASSEPIGSTRTAS